MKTIWIRITDRKNVTAISTKKKAINRIMERDINMTKKEAEEILNDEW